jgi:hypothetical protein
MKTYIDHNTTLQLNELWIPKDSANRHYQQFLEEQERGEAELIPYVSPAPTWEQIRGQRDQLLVQSDWTTLPDATPKPNKGIWLAYRQALRDITKTYPSPETVVWPITPS